MDDIFQGPTSIELETASALDALKIAYRGQYRPHDCSYIYDFLVFPNVLVETNGEYWHSLPNAVERDTNKASWALDHGYELVTLWEKAINTCGAYSLVVYLVLPVIDYEGTWFEQLSFHFESGR